MDLRQIGCVLAVARHGAVHRAAQTINVDQSVVSQKTRDLEAELEQGQLKLKSSPR